MPPATNSDPASAWAQSTVELPQDPGVSLTTELSRKTINLGLDQTIVDEGDVLHYTLSVENVGNTWLSAISVLDPALEGITCSPASSGSSFRFDVGAKTIVCTGSISVDQAMINAGFFESESKVSAPLPCRFTVPPWCFRAWTDDRTWHMGTLCVVSCSTKCVHWSRESPHPNQHWHQ